MSMTIETFKSLFAKYKPKDEGAWELDEDLGSLKQEVETRAAWLKGIRGDELYQGNKALADLLEEVDEMSLALEDLEFRWQKMNSWLVKQALKEVGKNIHALKQKFAAARPPQPTEGDKDLCMYIGWGFEALDRVYKRAKDELARRKVRETGETTGRSNGELVEGWNGINERYEFKHPDEWKRLVDRDKFELESLFDDEYQDHRRTKMTEVGSGVHVLDDTGGESKLRLQNEREATARMRSGLTGIVNSRTDKAKEDVKNNSDLAENLAGLLEHAPELLDTDGLLNRIVGSLVGQGQIAIPDNGWSKIKPEDEKDEEARRLKAEEKKQKQEAQNLTNRSHAKNVIESIGSAALRLKSGNGAGDDANKILQFISCFVDGLTEVTEGKKKAIEQFDKVWPYFRDVLSLTDDDKGRLLRRVQGYKEIAGGVSDTLSGKGTRKDDTRSGYMPTDTDYKIEDEDALIKGDISGSMHSCLLAQELSESLMGREVEVEGRKQVVKSGLKPRGEPVLVIDKEVLDARALDALALTAGGKAGNNDVVLHTAYEMINGMRAISGTPKVSQTQATLVMGAMLKGETFTNAMESLFSRTQLPWLATR